MDPWTLIWAACLVLVAAACYFAGRFQGYQRGFLDGFHDLRKGRGHPPLFPPLPRPLPKAPRPPPRGN